MTAKHHHATPTRCSPGRGCFVATVCSLEAVAPADVWRSRGGGVLPFSSSASVSGVSSSDTSRRTRPRLCSRSCLRVQIVIHRCLAFSSDHGCWQTCSDVHKRAARPRETNCPPSSFLSFTRKASPRPHSAPSARCYQSSHGWPAGEGEYLARYWSHWQQPCPSRAANAPPGRAS